MNQIIMLKSTLSLISNTKFIIIVQIQKTCFIPNNNFHKYNSVPNIYLNEYTKMNFHRIYVSRNVSNLKCFVSNNFRR